MEKKLLQTCLFLTLFGSLLISPIVRVSADSKQYDLRVTSVEGTTANYTYDQLLTMPETTADADLYCYGALVTSGNWGGVSLSYLLQQAGADPSKASSINFLASDGYQVAIPTEMAMRQDVIVAYEKDGSPLSEGFRLVVPGENGNIWIAMITSISLSTGSADGGQSGARPSEFGVSQLQTNSTGQSSTPQPQLVQTQNTTQENATIPSSTPQQQDVQTQNNTQENAASTAPVSPPANVTQPEQKSSKPQGSSPEGSSFPVEIGYEIAVGATVALLAAGYVVYRRKHARLKP